MPDTRTDLKMLVIMDSKLNQHHVLIHDPNQWVVVSVDGHYIADFAENIEARLDSLNIYHESIHFSLFSNYSHADSKLFVSLMNIEITDEKEE